MGCYIDVCYIAKGECYTSANQTVTILYKRLYNLYNLYNFVQRCT